MLYSGKYSNAYEPSCLPSRLSVLASETSMWTFIVTSICAMTQDPHRHARMHVERGQQDLRGSHLT